jgi:ferredoxin
MRVITDRDACDSYGQCMLNAPDVFTQDDDGKVVLLVAEPTADQEKEVLSAVDACPMQALRVEA